MKKVIFSIVGSTLFSLCAVQAQQQSDTTGTASGRQQQNSQYDKSRQQSDRTRHQGDNQAWQQQGDQSQYANEGMVVVDKNELPASLKQTLKQKKYAGWENGTIYHNTNTGEYVVAPRAYRFDEQGKEMEMGSSAQGYGSRQGTQGRYSSGDLNSQDPSRTRESETRQSPSQQSQSSQGEDQSTQSGQTERAQGQTQYPSQSPSSSQDQADNNQSSQSQQSRSSDQTQQSEQPSSSYRTDQSGQSGTGTQSGTRTQSGTDAQSQAGQSAQNQYRTEDMVEIQAEQVPAPLRRTLRGSQYKGWEENGTLYQDPSSSEYVLEMQSTNDASQPRVYRFDKSGQLKPGQNGTGNSDQ